MRHLRGSTLLAVGALALFAGCSSDSTSPTALDAASAEGGDASRFREEGSATRTFEITIENRTHGQPFTPPLVATHNGSVRLFHVRRPAGPGIREIAENGNLTPLHSELSSHRLVGDVVVAVSPGPGPLMPGESITFTIEANRGTPFLSFVSMLICTNDGFTGVDRGRLPRQMGQQRTMYLGAYDAGSEINTESFEDLVPPCPVLTGVPSDVPGTGTSNPALAENGVIRHHPNIQGGADLIPEIHAWRDGVARITMKRVG